MEYKMSAICATPTGTVEVRNMPVPDRAEPGHLLIKIHSCAINPGDKAFIGHTFPIGIVLSKYDIYGASGAGTVLETGIDVPEAYVGKKVAIYRSLKASELIVGTWSGYARMHYQDCAILPDDANMEEYSGSLVNIITPYAFLKQVTAEGHRGIISTAGSSATGIALLGICNVYNVPLISIVRNEKDRMLLEELGAKHVLAQDDTDFNARLKELSQQLSTTAIFDGVGGAILNKIFDVVPNGSTIYAYGYLGGPTPLTIHTSALMRGITVKGFSNFRTATVQDPKLLEDALKEISSFIHMPHFKTKTGKKFSFSEITDALTYTSTDGGRAILYP